MGGTVINWSNIIIKPIHKKEIRNIISSHVTTLHEEKKYYIFNMFISYRVHRTRGYSHKHNGPSSITYLKKKKLKQHLRGRF
jgi:hypothetical protein